MQVPDRLVLASCAQPAPSAVGDADEGEVEPERPITPACRGNATYDMRDRWLLELQSLWREYSVRELKVDNHHVIYVETWYLHHNLRPRCDHSRTVRLDHMDHLWLDDIRRAWHEYLQAAHVLHLEVVTPTPPRADSQRCIAHVLLTQGHVSFSLPDSLRTIRLISFRKRLPLLMTCPAFELSLFCELSPSLSTVDG